MSSVKPMAFDINLSLIPNTGYLQIFSNLPGPFRIVRVDGFGDAAGTANLSIGINDVVYQTFSLTSLPIAIVAGSPAYDVDATVGVSTTSTAISGTLTLVFYIQYIPDLDSTDNNLASLPLPTQNTDITLVGRGSALYQAPLSSIKSSLSVQIDGTPAASQTVLNFVIPPIYNSIASGLQAYSDTSPGDLILASDYSFTQANSNVQTDTYTLSEETDGGTTVYVDSTDPTASKVIYLPAVGIQTNITSPIAIVNALGNQNPLTFSVPTGATLLPPNASIAPGEVGILFSGNNSSQTSPVYNLLTSCNNPVLPIATVAALSTMSIIGLPNGYMQPVTAAPSADFSKWGSFRLDLNNTSTTNNLTILSTSAGGNTRWILDTASGSFSSTISGAYSSTQNIIFNFANRFVGLYLGNFQSTVGSSSYIICSLPQYLAPSAARNKAISIISGASYKAAAICQINPGNPGNITIGDVAPNGSNAAFASGTSPAGVVEGEVQYLL